MRYIRNKKLLILGAMLLAVALVVPGAVFAQSIAETGMSDFAAQAGFGGTSDIRLIIARLIRTVLSFGGVVLIGMIVYGGILWMISGGEQEKIKKARGVIVNAVIGLVIVLSAFAITQFVVSSLVSATSYSSSSSDDLGGPGFPGCPGCPTDTSSSFVVDSWGCLETVATQPKNSQIQILFNRTVHTEPSYISNNITVEAGSTPVDVNVVGSGQVITVSPNSSTCPDAPGDYFCEGTTYTVEVDDLFQSFDSTEIDCGDTSSISDSCSYSFSTSSEVDLTGPEIAITDPSDGDGVYSYTAVGLQASISDDVGVGTTDFSVNSVYVDSSAPIGCTGNGPMSCISEGVWTPGNLSPSSTHLIRATASDCSGNTTISDAVTVVATADHCSSTVQDEDETGVDCGGLDCAACTGDACTEDIECASNYCFDGECVNGPEITNVTPRRAVDSVPDGAPGNFVTISGSGFGEAQGVVTFMGDPDDESDNVNVPVVSCPTPAWSDTQIIVAVSGGAASGAIKVTTGVLPTLSDATDDDFGGFIPDFEVNDTVRPGLCSILPDEAMVGERITMSGVNFGTDPEEGGVYFDGSSVYEANFFSTIDTWSENLISVLIPPSTTGEYDISVFVLGEGSNSLEFEVLVSDEEAAIPNIDYVNSGVRLCVGDIETEGDLCSTNIDCDSGTCEDAITTGAHGQYVTIYGSGFGDNVGTVIFSDEDSGDVVFVPDFPAQCSGNWWGPTEIVVAVPDGLSTESFYNPKTIRVQTSEHPTTPESNSVEFTVDDIGVTPGICAISPSAGPVGTGVNLYGSEFGDTSEDFEIRFYDGSSLAPTVVALSSTETYVSEQEVGAGVPTGAVTGPMSIFVNSLSSNTTSFQVGDCNSVENLCTSAQTCCGDGSCVTDPIDCEVDAVFAQYAYSFTTGPIPSYPTVIEQCDSTHLSPVPSIIWSDGIEACTNAAVQVEFNPGALSGSMNRSTIHDGSFFVYECDGDGLDPCESVVEDDGGDPMPVPGLINKTNTTATFELLDDSRFTQNTWYEVTVTDEVSNSEGVSLQEDYVFRFKTRDDATDCEVEALHISPADYTALTADDLDYMAMPATAGCQVLLSSGYSYDWTLTNYEKDITFAGDVTSLAGASNEVVVEPNEETDDGQPTLVNAGVVGFSATDTEELIVDFVDPYVTEAIPQCNSACVNAQVGATFNTAMNANGLTGILGAHDEGDVSEANVRLFECTNEFCEEFVDGPITNPIIFSNDPLNDNDGLTFFFSEPLDPSNYYRVMIWGGIESESLPNEPAGVALWGDTNTDGEPVESLNYGDYYSWVFRTRDDATACGIGTVDITPSEIFLNAIGDRAAFSATVFGQPDECSLNGQTLNPLSYPWSWVVDAITNPINSSLASIATFLPDGGLTATLDTTSESLSTCSSNCLNTGSFAYEAVCGDGNVTQDLEHGWEDCDPARAGWGIARCTRNCKTVGVTACTETVTSGCCGNGIAEGREECDDGGNLNNDGCSSACLNEGSTKAGLTCGDNIVTHLDSLGGEECDDGNTVSGDGCSSVCLREGSVAIAEIDGICGDGNIEPGEDCDDLNSNDGDGCSSTCLQEPLIGTWFVGPSVNGVCGNGTLEPVVPSLFGVGEECDDGNTVNGDGCSAGCLNEGSSFFYDTPSFCGDGYPLVWSESTGGEECEIKESDGVPAYDPIQYLEIQPVAAQTVEDGETSTTITATGSDEETSTSANDTATIGLTCSCTNDADCGNITAIGCGLNGCCFERPSVNLSNTYPSGSIPGGQCRNTLVQARFTQEMAVASLFSNEEDPQPQIYLELIAEDVNGDNKYIPSDDGPIGDVECPSSYITYDFGAKNGVSRFFRKIVRVFWKSAWAQDTTCVIPANLIPTTIDVGDTDVPNFVTEVSVAYNQLLEPQSVYRLVIVRDGDISDNLIEGLASVWGVTMNGSTSNWYRTFVTGTEICLVDEVIVEDQSTSPGVMTSSGETHPLSARAYTYNGPYLEQLQEISGLYEWSWSGTDGPLTWGWTSSIPATSTTDSDVVVLNVVGETGVEATANVLTATPAINGQEVIQAQLRIDSTVDESIDVAGRIVSGTLNETVFLCENPWPSVESFPFADTAEFSATNDLAVSLSTPFTNFSFYYCRDDGDANDISDDLPALNIVEKTSGIEAEGVFKEFIFSVDDEDINDALGVRILGNEEYKSPLQWFADQGFVGSPGSESLDGFEGVRDGRTLYASAPNVSSEIYPNVYVVAYNEGASATTLEIYNRILEQWQFIANTNVATGESVVTNSRVCSIYVAGGDTDPVEVDGSVVSCTSNIDCANVSAVSDTGSPAEVFCDANKDKLRRDYIRLGDMRRIGNALESYGNSHGHCNVTKNQICFTSDDCSGDEICIASVPSLSSGTFIPSMSMSAWPSWQAGLANSLGIALPTDPLNIFSECPEGYEQASCYDALNALAMCPDDSHVYKYRAYGGESYELEADLEYGDLQDAPAWAYPIDTYDLGDIFVGNANESPSDGFYAVPSCVSDAPPFSAELMCGDGNIGAGEVCEIGDTTTVECETFVCWNDTDFSYNGLVCDPDAPECGVDGECFATSGVKTVACYEPGEPSGGPGCTGYPLAIDSDSACVPFFCGDGIWDCGPDEICNTADDVEDCDDGPLNGQYGYCDTNCSYIEAAYCGDGTLGGGEICDCGYNSTTNNSSDPSVCETPSGDELLNGTYYADPAYSCSANCSGPQAYCGDGLVTGDEECDGAVESWGGALCADGTICTTDADCSTGSCNDAYECPLTSSGITQVRTRACNGIDTSDISNSCVWPLSHHAPGGWGDCQPTGSCGNGVKEGFEECDDGNEDNSDACLDTCVANVCGDGYRNAEVEACDMGGANGIECEAAYGDDCTYCSTTCNYLTKTGTYCGDGEINGGEYCDGDQVPSRCYKASTNPDERDVGGVCEEDSNCWCWGPNDENCGSDYTCEAQVGICNGIIGITDDGGEMNFNGAPCSYGNPLDTSSNCGIAELFSAFGECVPQNCNNSCSLSCPFTLEQGAVLAQAEGESARSTEIDLYSYFSGPSPDQAEFFFPACTVGTRLLADVSFANVIDPEVDVMFLVDLSTSMERDINGLPPDDDDDTPNLPKSRMEIVEDGLESAVNDLFNAFSPGKIEVSIATFSSSTTVPIGEFRNTPHTAGTQQSFTSSESEVLEAVTTRLTPTGNTPTPDGLDWAYYVMNQRVLDYPNRGKIVVLLTDGSPNAQLATTYSGVIPSTNPINVIASVEDAYNVSQLLQDNLGVEVYTGAFTSAPYRIARANHLSSDICDTNYSDLTLDGNPTCVPAENGVEYAYDAETEEEFNDMMENIVNNILGLNVSYLTSTGYESAAVTDGNDVVLPFPPGFLCQTGETGIPIPFDIPMFTTFNSSEPENSTVNISNIRLEYCPFE